MASLSVPVDPSRTASTASAATDLKALLRPEADAGTVATPADNRLASSGGVTGLLNNGNRNIDTRGLVEQVRKNGYVGVVVLDDTRPRATGSHASHVQASLVDSLPTDIKLGVGSKVRIKVISAYDANGVRNLTGALAEAKKLVDAGKVQLIVGGADYVEDEAVTLPALSRTSGRPLKSFDQVTRNDLDKALVEVQRTHPDFGRALGQVQALAGRVPYVVAGGNDGEGSALSLASQTISVGAKNADGSRAMSAGYFEAYASGTLPIVGSLGGLANKGFSSYAAPRVAGDIVSQLFRTAGLTPGSN